MRRGLSKRNSHSANADVSFHPFSPLTKTSVTLSSLYGHFSERLSSSTLLRKPEAASRRAVATHTNSLQRRHSHSFAALLWWLTEIYDIVEQKPFLTFSLMPWFSRNVRNFQFLRPPQEQFQWHQRSRWPTDRLLGLHGKVSQFESFKII